MPAAIEAHDLRKAYGMHRALDGLSFRLNEATVLGVLGPNGSGKTTAVKAVTGLCAIDSGQVHIHGRNVRQEPDAVKSMIGLSGQYAAVDGDLTTLENLVLVARLHGSSRRQATIRATELIDEFGMQTYARRPAGHHSGGMRRRLDLACALIGNPSVLVLDEPTTGLDPTSRVALWETIRGLVRAGTSLLLTTQYLEEADVLADRVLVIDNGRAVAEGTPEELKGRLGGDRVTIDLVRPEQDTASATKALREVPGATVTADESENGRVILRTPEASRKLAVCLSALAQAQIEVAGISVSEPTLDEVFFALTGAAPTTLVSTETAKVVA